MIVLGAKPSQVDILNFLDGVEFGQAITHANLFQLGGREVAFLSLKDLIATKAGSGRPKDIDDLNRLREELGPDYPG